MLHHLRTPGRISAEADELYKKGDYERALGLYERVIHLDPKNELAYANKGGVLRRLGRTKEALVALDTALELNPKDVWAYDERGRVHSALGKYESAIQDFDKAIQLDPRYEFAYSGKAIVLVKLDQYKDALGLLDKILELDPESAGAYAARGSIYHDHLYRYEAAYQDLKRASGLAPSQVYYRADLAEAALTSQRFKEAFDLASEILAGNENMDISKFDVSDRMAMRFITISALLLQGHAAQAKTKLEELVNYYKSVTPDFKRDWDYSGDRHFIESLAIDGRPKSVILTLIGFLSQPPQSTIKQVEKSVSGLR